MPLKRSFSLRRRPKIKKQTAEEQAGALTDLNVEDTLISNNKSVTQDSIVYDNQGMDEPEFPEEETEAKQPSYFQVLNLGNDSTEDVLKEAKGIVTEHEKTYEDEPNPFHFTGLFGNKGTIPSKWSVAEKDNKKSKGTKRKSRSDLQRACPYSTANEADTVKEIKSYKDIFGSKDEDTDIEEDESDDEGEIVPPLEGAKKAKCPFGFDLLADAAEAMAKINEQQASPFDKVKLAKYLMSPDTEEKVKAASLMSEQALDNFRQKQAMEKEAAESKATDENATEEFKEKVAAITSTPAKKKGGKCPYTQQNEPPLSLSAGFEAVPMGKVCPFTHKVPIRNESGKIPDITGEDYDVGNESANPLIDTSLDDSLTTNVTQDDSYLYSSTILDEALNGSEIQHPIQDTPSSDVEPTILEDTIERSIRSLSRESSPRKGGTLKRIGSMMRRKKTKEVVDVAIQISIEDMARKEKHDELVMALRRAERLNGVQQNILQQRNQELLTSGKKYEDAVSANLKVMKQLKNRDVINDSLTKDNKALEEKLVNIRTDLWEAQKQSTELQELVNEYRSLIEKLRKENEELIQDCEHYKNLYITTKKKSSETLGEYVNQLNGALDDKRALLKEKRKGSTSDLRKQLVTTDDYLKVTADRNKLIEELEEMTNQMVERELHIEDLQVNISELTKILHLHEQSGGMQQYLDTSPIKPNPELRKLYAYYKAKNATQDQVAPTKEPQEEGAVGGKPMFEAAQAYQAAINKSLATSAAIKTSSEQSTNVPNPPTEGKVLSDGDIQTTL